MFATFPLRQSTRSRRPLAEIGGRSTRKSSTHLFSTPGGDVTRMSSSSSWKRAAGDGSDGSPTGIPRV
jgi:hypothetical protein